MEAIVYGIIAECLVSFTIGISGLTILTSEKTDNNCCSKLTEFLLFISIIRVSQPLLFAIIMFFNKKVKIFITIIYSAIITISMYSYFMLDKKCVQCFKHDSSSIFTMIEINAILSIVILSIALMAFIFLVVLLLLIGFVTKQ
jgi:hypothetical protein